MSRRRRSARGAPTFGGRPGDSPRAGPGRGGACLARPRALRPDRADRACRPQGRAHLPPVRLDEVAKARPQPARDDLDQLVMNAIGIVRTGQPQALGNPEHVRVDRDRGVTEGIAAHDVRGLESDSGQSGQRIALPRDHPPVALDEGAGHADERPSLGPIETRRSGSRSPSSRDRPRRSPGPSGISGRAIASPGSRARRCTGRPGSSPPATPVASRSRGRCGRRDRRAPGGE